MPNSPAEPAKSATVAGNADADAKPRVSPRRRGSENASAPGNGITVTRPFLGVALAVLGGAYMLQWDRTTRVEAEVRDLRVELHTEINGLRQELRADMRVLRDEIREEIGVLREEIGVLREEIGAVREEVRVLREEVREDIRELAALIRSREATSQ